jgi:phosphoribosylanthranilate isomerase
VTRVKICGLTRIEDAELAVSLGAAAVGLVLWPRSPRHVGVDAARAIVAALPPFVLRVGVFVNQAPEEVARVAGAVGLDAVQLHGHEAVAKYEALPYRLIKAVPIDAESAPEDALRVAPDVTVLLDAHDPGRFGGTGRTIDWTLAAAVARRRRVILSGGLRPENVGQAVDMVRPYAVDVSSGVEARPGVKDPARLRAFFDALGGGREADVESTR